MLHVSDRLVLTLLVELIAELMCSRGNEFFCEMSSFNWASYTMLMFLISLPIIFIEDLRKFKWVNIAALVTLAVLIVWSMKILIFDDVTDKPDIYDNVRLNS